MCCHGEGPSPVQQLTPNQLTSTEILCSDESSLCVMVMGPSPVQQLTLIQLTSTEIVCSHVT